MQISGRNLNKSQLLKNSRIINKFRHMSFKYKLILSFIFVSIIPILIIQSFSYYNISLSMKKKVNDLTVYNLEQTAKNLDFLLNSYTDGLYQIYTNDEIVSMVNKMNEGNKDTRALTFNILRNQLKNHTGNMEGLRSIAILCSNGDVVFYDAITGSSLSSIWENYKDVRKTDIYTEAMRNNNMVLIPTAFAENRFGKDYYLFHIAKKMFDFNNLDQKGIGVAVFSIDEAAIYNACNQIGTIGQSNSNVKSINFVMDRNGSVVSFPEKKYIGLNINKYHSDIKGDADANLKVLLNDASIFKGKSVLINKFYDKNNEWTIVNAVDQDYLFNDIYRMQKITILFGVVAILFSILVIVFITRNFSTSIGKILKAMKTAGGGELTVQVELDSEDEISTIAARFNKMILQINKLVDEVKEVSFKQKEAEVKALDAQIRALEAQINPHFLYNTLDSINWMAVESEEFEISRMLYSLSQILRYSISENNKLVKIREEMLWLERYIYLQQNRFSYSFNYQVDIDEDILDFKIYKLLFQPFVENSIIHGFAGLQAGGNIRISIKPFDENDICILIEDNGKGMGEDVVKLLSQAREEGIRTEGKGLGVSNALNRMKLYYEGKVSWTIRSETGKGTSISLIIPKIV
jgi:two-component system sensor histidine kinase YesM